MRTLLLEFLLLRRGLYSSQDSIQVRILFGNLRYLGLAEAIFSSFERSAFLKNGARMQ